MRRLPIKPKTGFCPDCNDGKVKALVGKRCQYHYWLPKRSKIAPRSKKRAKQERKYLQLREIHLLNNSECDFPGCCRPATDVHHPEGRIGDRLLKSETFVSLCREHHVWVELNPIDAKKLGLSKSRLVI